MGEPLDNAGHRTVSPPPPPPLIYMNTSNSRSTPTMSSPTGASATVAQSTTPTSGSPTASKSPNPATFTPLQATLSTSLIPRACYWERSGHLRLLRIWFSRDRGGCGLLDRGLRIVLPLRRMSKCVRRVSLGVGCRIEWGRWEEGKWEFGGSFCLFRWGKLSDQFIRLNSLLRMHTKIQKARLILFYTTAQ
jgi:hypothetical protein